MERPYLFIFGFETPTQAANNRKHGWDDEDSEAVFIKADNEEEALQWGTEIAEEFMRKLYGDEKISWKALRFAYWIEPEDDCRWSTAQLEKIPTVSVGEFPNIHEMVRRRLELDEQ